jgi:glucose-6-phosphate 1-dehydrogenase
MTTNPLREGLEQERVPDASCLVIFGASGDLTQRKLIPALYSADRTDDRRLRAP